MSCNKCNGGCNSCECTCNKRCINERCDCPTLLSSDCVTSFTEDLPCSGVLAGQTLNETLLALDAYICEKFGSVTNFFNLVNVGDGVEVYNGVDNLGQKEIKTLRSDSLSITATATEISIEQPMSAIVPALYINSAYIPTYDEFVSGNTKGEGTLAKPYTNTVVYSSPSASPTITANSAIQNGIDAYVGTGTRLNPELEGQKLIIQNNNDGYIFSGDLNYSYLDLVIQSNVLSTNTGYVIDMDNSAFFDSTTSSARITIEKGVEFEIQGLGFKNSGNTVSTNNFVTGRGLVCTGEGTILSQVNDPSKYVFNLDPVGVVNGTTGLNNDGNTAIFVDCTVRSVYSGIVKVGGKSRITLNGNITTGLSSITVNAGMKAFHSTGGRINMSDSKVFVFGGMRNTVFSFEPTNGFVPEIVATGVELQGQATSWFTKSNTLPASFNWQNGTGIFFTASTLFASPNMWVITFNNNNIPSNVDTSIVDFGQNSGVSSLNLLGGYVALSLVTATSKKNATDNGIPKLSLFLNRKTISAGSFIVGEEYKIASIGTTNFTTIGASANTVGLHFTASSAGTGSGSAYLDKLDIVT